MTKGVRPEPPPEGALLKAALKRRRMSSRKAAPLANLSEARWRQIVSGYQIVSGTYSPVRAPADTLARMARVAGVTPDQLTEVGRADAAEELTTLIESEPQPTSEWDDDPRYRAFAAILETLTPQERVSAIRRYEEQMGQIPPPSERNEDTG